MILILNGMANNIARDILNDFLKDIIGNLLLALFTIINALFIAVKFLASGMLPKMFSNNSQLNTLFNVMVSLAIILLLTSIIIAITKIWLKQANNRDQHNTGSNFLGGVISRAVPAILLWLFLPVVFFFGLSIIGLFFNLLFGNTDPHYNIVDIIWASGFANASKYQAAMAHPDPFGIKNNITAHGYNFWIPLFSTLGVTVLLLLIAFKIVSKWIDVIFLYVAAGPIAIKNYVVDAKEGKIGAWLNDIKPKVLIGFITLLTLNIFLLLTPIFFSGLTKISAIFSNATIISLISVCEFVGDYLASMLRINY